MPINKIPKKWRMLNSLWILWTLTIFFHYVAFFYIGIRTRYERWLWWGVFYSLSFLAVVAYLVVSVEIGYRHLFLDVFIPIWLIMSSLVSFIHAVVIREEYYLRLIAYRETLRKRIAEDYGLPPHDGGRSIRRRQAENIRFTSGVNPAVNRDWTTPQKVFDGEIDIVNVNEASEGELSELPGVTVIMAKKAIQFREKSGPFRSIDHFAEVLDINPIILEQIRGSVVTET